MELQVSWLRMTMQRRPRLQAAVQSVERFKLKVRQLFPQGRGRNLNRFTMEDLNPLLRGWANYYRKATTSNLFEDLDRWIRRKLRCLIWQRWARVRTRARQLIKLGFTEKKAWCCARSGRGPWWNAGSSHMNAAYPTPPSSGWVSSPSWQPFELLPEYHHSHQPP